MKKTQGSFTAKELKDWSVFCDGKGTEATWMPARPYHLWTIARIKQAFDVLFMKADAVYWEEDKK